MPTGTILLPIAGAILPDGSASNIAAQFARVKSSAAAPDIHWVELQFDPNTEQSAYWSWRMPFDYSSSPVLKLHWYANATLNAVVWGAMLAVIAPAAAADMTTKALAAANTVTANVLATTAKRLTESAITLTNNDSLAAGSWVTLRVYRDATNVADTCTVVSSLIAVSLEYTTL